MNFLWKGLYLKHRKGNKLSKYNIGQWKKKNNAKKKNKEKIYKQ